MLRVGGKRQEGDWERFRGGEEEKKKISSSYWSEFTAAEVWRQTERQRQRKRDRKRDRDREVRKKGKKRETTLPETRGWGN